MGRPEAVSIVLPLLNEADNLEPLHAQLAAAMKAGDRPYEVLYVDDGSTDGSWEVLRRLAAADPHVRLLRLRRNFGQTAALAAGIAHARYPLLVTLDADLQNDPADIPRLLDALDGHDLVCGWRRARQDAWLTRRLPSAIANGVIRLLTGVPVHDFGCTLRAYRRDVVADVHLYGEFHRYLPVLVHSVGGRIVEQEVTHHPRVSGHSKYGLRRTLKVLVDLLTIKFLGDFSASPNRVFGGFGLLSLALGMAALAVVAYRLFVLHRLEATPLMFMMVVFFLTGVLSILIGFLAEMVVRGFYETQRKPSYFVREVVEAGRVE
jgi:glycosyltransferase involved in cell wall biosynthesis